MARSQEKLAESPESLKTLQERATYHSLSIEGYRVNAELIERVKGGHWNPDDDETDRERRKALAARGYWQAYQLVQESLEKILNGQNPGKPFGTACPHTLACSRKNPARQFA